LRKRTELRFGKNKKRIKSPRDNNEKNETAHAANFDKGPPKRDKKRRSREKEGMDMLP